ncbi:MAG TPA: hypothetical protein VF092_04425 [Longimicrobium sp.]
MSLSLDQLRVTSFETGAPAVLTVALPTTTHGEDCFSFMAGCPPITR